MFFIYCRFLRFWRALAKANPHCCLVMHESAFFLRAPMQGSSVFVCFFTQTSHHFVRRRSRLASSLDSLGGTVPTPFRFRLCTLDCRFSRSGEVVPSMVGCLCQLDSRSSALLLALFFSRLFDIRMSFLFGRWSSPDQNVTANDNRKSHDCPVARKKLSGHFNYAQFSDPMGPQSGCQTYSSPITLRGMCALMLILITARYRVSTGDDEACFSEPSKARIRPFFGVMLTLSPSGR